MKKIIVTIMFIMLIACDNKFIDSALPSSSKHKSEASLGESFHIKIGNEIFFESESLTLRFESVPIDCRCPNGALCIWEGYAEIVLKAEKKGLDPLTLIISTYNGDQDSVIFPGYSLQWVGLTPYPSIDVERDTTAYDAELILRKLP